MKQNIIFLLVSAVLCFIYLKCTKTSLKLKTTLLSLGISACLAVGINCFLTWYSFAAFGKRYLHPIAYPMSITVGFIALFALILFAIIYLHIRFKNKSFKLLLMDVFTSIIFLPFFASIYSLIVNIASHLRGNVFLTEKGLLRIFVL